MMDNFQCSKFQIEELNESKKQETREMLKSVLGMVMGSISTAFSIAGASPILALGCGSFLVGCAVTFFKSLKKSKEIKSQIKELENQLEGGKIR